MIDNGVREVEIIKSNDKGFKIVGNYSFNDRTHKRSINFDIKNKRFIIIDIVSHKNAIANFNIADGNDFKEILMVL